MGIDTTKIEHKFTCEQCGDSFLYLQPLNPTQKLPDETVAKLRKLVTIVDPASSPQQPYEIVLCSDECAILAIESGKHRKTIQLTVAPPPAASGITLAGEQDVKRAIAGDAVVKAMTKKRVNYWR